MNRLIIVAATLAAAAAYSIYANRDGPSISDEPPAPIAALKTAPPAVVADREPDQVTQADDGTEVVLGLRVRTDRDCEIELKDYVTPAGEMFSAYTCTPSAIRPPHEYAHYDDDALASLAYSDASAAALLGQRLIERDTGKSYELLIRATALDGDTQHIAWLADMAFGNVDINGEPQVGNLKRQYELAALTVRLGGDPAKARFLRNELVKTGLEQGQLDALDQRADALQQAMRDIQRTVLGEVTIGGQDNA